MTRRVIAVAAIVVILAGLSFYSQGLVRRAFDACVNYRSPFLFTMPPGGATPALSNQVVLIVVDGLRADTAETMATVKRLMASGTTATMVTGQPSLSVPGAASIESGTLQEIHGVTTNWYKDGLKVDSIFTAANRAGLTWFGADGDSYSRFGQVSAGPVLGEWRNFAQPGVSPEEYDRSVFEAGRAAVAAGTNLVFMHYSATDEMAHAHGARSDQYAQAAATIDGYIGQIADLALARGGTVLVTADHGHIKTGGHGGGEDEVTHVLLALAGAGVKAGTSQLVGSQADLAPTVAELVGAPVPSSATGQILYPLLVEPAIGWSTRAALEAERQTVFTNQYLAAIKANALPQTSQDELTRIKSGAQAGQNVFDEVQKYITMLTEARAGAKQTALAGTRGERVPLTILLAVLPLGLFVPFMRRKLFGKALLSSLVYVAVYNLFYFGVHRYRWSFSAFNSEDRMTAFFGARMIEAAIAVLAAALVLGLIARRARRSGVSITRLDVAEGSVVMSLSITCLLVLQALLFYVLWGVKFPFYMPNLTLGFKFYMDMLQLVATGAAALPALALAVFVGGWRFFTGRAVQRA